MTLAALSVGAAGYLGQAVGGVAFAAVAYYLIVKRSRHAR